MYRLKPLSKRRILGLQLQIKSEHAALDYLSNYRYQSPNHYAVEQRISDLSRLQFLKAINRIGQNPADLKSWQQNAVKIAKRQGSGRRMSAQRHAEDLCLPPKQAWQLIGEGLYSPFIWPLLDQLLIMELKTGFKYL